MELWGQGPMGSIWGGVMGSGTRRGGVGAAVPPVGSRGTPPVTAHRPAVTPHPVPICDPTAMAAALALLGLMGFYGAAHGETLKATAAGG